MDSRGGWRAREAPRAAAAGAERALPTRSAPRHLARVVNRGEAPGTGRRRSDERFPRRPAFPNSVRAMDIQHDTTRKRFNTRLDGGEAYLAYERPRPGVLDLQHTIVPDQEQGRGVGESLVRAAIGYAREHGERIIPSCPFVESWLAKHPDEGDVLEEG